MYAPGKQADLAMPIIMPDRPADSFHYHAEIQKPHGALDAMIDWCQQECEQEWRWSILESSGQTRPGRYLFYFDSDRDCCAFTLKWL